MPQSGRHCLPFAWCHKAKAGPANGACTVEYVSQQMCKRVSVGAGGVRVGGGRVQRSWLHRLTATPMRTTSGQNWLQVMRTEAAHPKEGTPLTPHAPSPVPQLRVAGISGQNMVSSCYWPRIMACVMSASVCVREHMWLSLALEPVKLLNNALHQFCILVCLYIG